MGFTIDLLSVGLIFNRIKNFFSKWDDLVALGHV
jgi:hypothetical protein